MLFMLISMLWSLLIYIAPVILIGGLIMRLVRARRNAGGRVEKRETRYAPRQRDYDVIETEFVDKKDEE